MAHIYELFNNLKVVNDTLYYQKIISIAVGGHWEADAENYFQEGLRNRVIKNSSLTFELLENSSDEEIKSFWYFYFDEPNPDENIPKEFNNMKIVSPKIYSLMEVAHKEVLKDADL